MPRVPLIEIDKDFVLLISRTGIWYVYYKFNPMDLIPLESRLNVKNASIKFIRF